MYEFLGSLGRKVSIVNLDPGNTMECDVCIRDLICTEKVMEELELGPNGALVYCMRYLEEHVQWLLDRLSSLGEDVYVLFDLPGQVELYTHENSMHSVFEKLTKSNYRLASVHLVDAHYCTDRYKFVSVLLLSLSAMIKMELPHVNVLSKVDLIQQFGTLDFGLEFYTDVLDLNQLLAMEKDGQYNKLTKKLIECIEDYSLVKFVPLNVQDGQNMMEVIKLVDKCNGCAFVDTGDMQQAATNALQDSQLRDLVGSIQEKYMD